jgi:hypothetical protein
MNPNRGARTTRRSFLKSLGAAAAALPFYRLLEHSAVQAATGERPLAFVGVAGFHGKPQRYFARRAGETDTTYDLGYADCALRPFDDAATYGQSFKDRLAIFEGFDYGVGEVSPDGGAMHVPMHGALGMFLTGSSARGGGGIDWDLQGASLDQYLAGRFGGETPFRSLELTVESDMGFGSWSANTIAYGAGGQKLSRLTHPAEIWDLFFASFVPGDDPGAAAAAARQRRIRGSVLDFVAADLGRINGRLAGSERQKLDQHLTAVRDLERRLTSEVAGACTPPPRHPAGPPSSPSYVVANANNGGLPYLDLIADFHIELLAQILLCDLTRFATIVLPGSPGSGTAAPTPQVPDPAAPGRTTDAAVGTDLPVPADFHNKVAHLYAEDAELTTQRQAAAVSRYYHGKVARLMQLLADGGGLDSTLILIGNEGGHGGGHSTTHVPILLAGGANGRVRLGRRIVAPGRVAQVGRDCTGIARTSHNPILVAVANAFGADLASYGVCADPAMTAGIGGLL